MWHLVRCYQDVSHLPALLTRSPAARDVDSHDNNAESHTQLLTPSWEQQAQFRFLKIFSFWHTSTYFFSLFLSIFTENCLNRCRCAVIPHPHLNKILLTTKSSYCWVNIDFCFCFYVPILNIYTYKILVSHPDKYKAGKCVKSGKFNSLSR